MIERCLTEQQDILKMKNKIVLVLSGITLMLTISVLLSSWSRSTEKDKVKMASLKQSSIGYWDRGLAEISRYDLTQNRYKDEHPGEVIMIFVKEDFLTDQQVKNERYKNPNSAPVLKNILLKKFTTGIYDYTMSTNTFTPFDQKEYSGSLKVQCSSTEWCGTSYVQLNHRGDSYNVELRSYFESEGDKNFDIPEAIIEDELFNLIRIDPTKLSTGDITIVPSMTYLRLTHRPIEAVKARIKSYKYNGKEFEAKEIDVLQIDFPELSRMLSIYYSRSYPHSIVGWDDTYPSMFDKKHRTTSARLSHQINEAYWKLNNKNDKVRQRELGLAK